MSEVYAGLDISDKATQICLMDRDGAVAWRGKCASDPEVISVLLAKQVARLGVVLVRAVLETGPLSVFLYHGLREREVPVIWISGFPGTVYRFPDFRGHGVIYLGSPSSTTRDFRGQYTDFRISGFPGFPGFPGTVYQ